MRPDGTEPMTPADLRPGDVITQSTGAEVRINAVSEGRYGILIDGIFPFYDGERYQDYVLFECPPPEHILFEWHGLPSFGFVVVGGRRWASVASRRWETPYTAATYDDLSDAWRAEQASSGGQISAEHQNAGMAPVEQ